MGKEMRTLWVGPMPLGIFLKKFMKLPGDGKKSPVCLTVAKTFFEGAAAPEVKTERARYLVLLKLLESNPELLPGLKLVDTSNRADPNGDQNWRIDITGYDEELVNAKQANQLNKAAFGMEIKEKDSCDPFNDKGAARFEKNEEKHEAVRGQLAMYATEWFSHQHHTHMFMAFICKTKSRFIYFDRAGAVVSESFEYAKDSQPLVHFLWRLSQMDNTQRGIDTTIHPATRSEVALKEKAIKDEVGQATTLGEDNLFRQKLKAFHTRVAITELNDKVLESFLEKKKEPAVPDSPGKPAKIVSSIADLTDEDWERYWDEGEENIKKSMIPEDLNTVETMAEQRMPTSTREVIVMQVLDASQPKGYREIIIQGLSLNADSLVGRSTRAYSAWDLTAKKLCYVKDYWQSNLRGMEVETDILEELKKGGVKNIPNIICGGDVEAQKTRSNTFARKVCKLTSRVHHRFLVDFIGRPLKHFTRSKQMLQVTYDAFIAHKEAWEKCSILHRDISGNNVMLDRWGRGVLNDWDLSKKKSMMTEPPRTHARTGTWYYMSTLILMQPGKPHEVQDDLESFVLLVLYHTLSYLKHNKDNSLGDLIADMFGTCKELDGKSVGGDRKYAMFTGANKFEKKIKPENNKPLRWWLHKACRAVGKWIYMKVRLENASKSDNTSYDSESDDDSDDGMADETKFKLYSHEYLDKNFKEALQRGNWPHYNDKFKHDFVRKNGGTLKSKSFKRGATERDASDACRTKRLKEMSDMPSVDESDEGRVSD